MTDQAARGSRHPHPFLRYWRLKLLFVLLVAGFILNSMIGFEVSRKALHDNVMRNELPLTTDNIYSEIQKDLIQPVHASAMMASDTFLRDWILAGQQDPDKVYRYLQSVQQRTGAFMAFLVAEPGHRYYYHNAQTKVLDPARPDDGWYFRLQHLDAPYELNVDQDSWWAKKLVVYVNYRMLDAQGQFLGATGVGIAVHDLQILFNRYQKRFDRDVYFVNAQGQVVLSTSARHPAGQNLSQQSGMQAIVQALKPGLSQSMDYTQNGGHYWLNLRYIPELKWYLMVEKSENEATRDLRHTLYWNLLYGVLVSLVVGALLQLLIHQHNRQMERLAQVDGLTQLPNRRACSMVVEQAMQRPDQSLALLLLDVDYFKQINDIHGHLAGDAVLQHLAARLRESCGPDDFVCRWGGEEFLLLWPGLSPAQAHERADQLTAALALAPYEHEGELVRFSVSGGVAVRQEGESWHDWIRRADQQLYLAKSQGRNQVCASA